MVTWKLLSIGKWMLFVVLALTPVFATGCSSTSGSRGSDGHIGHSH